MQSTIGPFNLASTFLRLRNDVSVESLPVSDTFRHSAVDQLNL